MPDKKKRSKRDQLILDVLDKYIKSGKQSLSKADKDAFKEQAGGADITKISRDEVIQLRADLEKIGPSMSAEEQIGFVVGLGGGGGSGKPLSGIAGKFGRGARSAAGPAGKAADITLRSIYRELISGEVSGAGTKVTKTAGAAARATKAEAAAASLADEATAVLDRLVTPGRKIPFGPLAGLKSIDLPFGGGGEEEESDFLTISADLLSTDIDDLDTALGVLARTQLEELNRRVASNQALSQEDIMTFSNISRMMAGQASQPEKLAMLDTAISEGFFARMVDGSFDDPDELYQAAAMVSQRSGEIQQRLAQIDPEFARTLVGGGQSAEASTDDVTRLYEEELRAQAEREQMEFQRAGIMDLLSAAPSAFRLQLLEGLSQSMGSKHIQRLFFGDFGKDEEAAPSVLPAKSKFVIK